MYNCSNGTCRNIPFSIALNLTKGTTLEKANEFNKSKLFAKVYLDSEMDPWLRMTHNVHGGVTNQNLAYTLETFDIACRAFVEHFNFKL